MDNKGSSQDFGLNSDVLAEDRALDMLGQGQSFDESDQLFALLSAAKEQADANIPSPPMLADLLGDPVDAHSAESVETPATNVIPLRKSRHKLTRRGAGAAVAAGGTSITTMLVAGGVAAALAVGGLSFAAYSTKQPESAHSQDSANGSGSNQFGTDGSVVSDDASSSIRKPEATDKDKPSPSSEPAAPRESEPETPATEIAPTIEIPTASEVPSDLPELTTLLEQPLAGMEDTAGTDTDTTATQPAPTEATGTNDGNSAESGTSEPQQTAPATPTDEQQSNLPLQGEAPYDQEPTGSTDTRY